MAYINTTTPVSAANDSSFRATIDAVHAALAGCGLVQTSDTGQVDTGTVSAPSSEMTNTSTNVMGYSVWRMDDAAQASNPVFLKCFFGGGDTASSFRMFFQVGKASNGSGTLSSTRTTSFQAGSSGDTSSRFFFGCPTPDGFLFICAADGGQTSAGQYHLIFVERLRDVGGDLTGDIFHGGTVYVGSTGYSSHLWRATSGSWSPLNVYPLRTGTYGDGKAWPAILWPEGMDLPLRGLALGHTGAFADGDTGYIDIANEGPKLCRALPTLMYAVTSNTSFGTAFGNGTTGDSTSWRLLVREAGL